MDYFKTALVRVEQDSTDNLITNVQDNEHKSLMYRTIMIDLQIHGKRFWSEKCKYKILILTFQKSDQNNK